MFYGNNTRISGYKNNHILEKQYYRDMSTGSGIRLPRFTSRQLLPKSVNLGKSLTFSVTQVCLLFVSGR